MNKYRIEFIPRYGTTIGIIWALRSWEDFEGSINEKEEVIGHVRIQSEDEKEEWIIAIQKLNETLKVE